MTESTSGREQQVNRFSRWVLIQVAPPSPKTLSGSFFAMCFLPRLLICVSGGKKTRCPDCGTSAVFAGAWPPRRAGAAPSPPKATFFYSHVLPEQTALLSGPVPPLTGHCPGNMHCCSMQICPHWDRDLGRGYPELRSQDRKRRLANKWKFALNPLDNRGRGWGRASKPR